MILNWNDFNKWRETSLEYHKMIGEHNYTNALTFFEYARQYFNSKGFPPPEKKTKTGVRGRTRYRCAYNINQRINNQQKGNGNKQVDEKHEKFVTFR